MKRETSDKRISAAGFSLLECVIALFIITVGMLAVAALSAVAIQGENFAFSSTDAALLANGKMEELKAGTLTNGGSLTANVPGYSDSPSQRFYRRWQIADGPAGTKEVTVVIVSQQSVNDVRTTQIKTLIR